MFYFVNLSFEFLIILHFGSMAMIDYQTCSCRGSQQPTWNHQFPINSPNVDHLTQNSRIWPFVLKLGGGEMLKILLKVGYAPRIHVYANIIF